MGLRSVSSNEQNVITMQKLKGGIIGFRKDGENGTEITIAFSVANEHLTIPLLKDVELVGCRVEECEILPGCGFAPLPATHSTNSYIQTAHTIKKNISHLSRHILARHL